MVDNNLADGSITTSPATDEASASQAPANQASSEAAPNQGGDAATGSAEQATAPSTPNSESSLTNQTGPQNAEQKPAVNEWEQKYHAIQKDFGRMRQTYGTMRQQLDQFQQQFQGIDPNAVKAWRQQQDAAAQAKLPKWHTKNPERPAFQQSYTEYSRLLRGWQRAESPEAKAAFAAEIEQMPADIRQEIGAFEQHKRSTNERIAEEMTGYNSLEEMIAAKAMGIMQQERAKVEAETRVNTWFDDPANAPAVEHTREAMAEAIQAGVPLPYVQEMAKMRHKLDILESRLTNTDQVAAAAQARTQVAKQNASITRDTSGGARRVNPVQVAKERGITDLASSAYVNLLSELSSKGLI